MSATWTLQEDTVLRDGISAGLSKTRMLSRLPGRTARGLIERARRLGLELPA